MTINMLVSVVFCLIAMTSVGGIPLKVNSLRTAEPHIPDADGMLHVYVLPVGQGNSHVIQCPSGHLSILDMGSSDSNANGFWGTNEIISFLQGQFDLIHNIILSHVHYDHYSYITSVLEPNTTDLSGLTNFYTTCTFDFWVYNLQVWYDSIDPTHSMLRLFNGGSSCGPNGVDCGQLDLCPNDSEVTVMVMAANMDECSGSFKNVDSLVFKVTHGSVSIMFNGDYEDRTYDWDEDGPLKALVDYYGSELAVTISKLAHHGAASKGNKPIYRNATMARAIFASMNPWYSNYRHPRCEVIDGYKSEIATLCKPNEVSEHNPHFCGYHPMASVPSEDRLQSIYTCGDDLGGLTTHQGNEFAIYTTMPDDVTINCIDLMSNGTNWGFINNLTPKAALLKK